MHEPIVADLVELGLSRNEALAWLTLVEEPRGEGLTGYEVAARSGIPRSAVYTVLRKLEQAEIAFPAGEPARYHAVPPARLVERMRTQTLGRLESLEERLESLPPRAQPEPIWQLRRYEDVIERADSLIRSADRSVWVSAWAREFVRLAPAMREIAEDPLHRVLHSVDELTEPLAGWSCWEGTVRDDAKASWAHRLLVVVDRRVALIGGAEISFDNHAVWTTNPSLVDLATNHVILDITLLSRRGGRDCTDDVVPMLDPR